MPSKETARYYVALILFALATPIDWGVVHELRKATVDVPGLVFLSLFSLYLFGAALISLAGEESPVHGTLQRVADVMGYAVAAVIALIVVGSILAILLRLIGVL